MKILLLGANGQVGWELQRSLAPLGQMKACDRHALDLGNFEGLRACTRDYRPEINSKVWQGLWQTTTMVNI